MERRRLRGRDGGPSCGARRRPRRPCGPRARPNFTRDFQEHITRLAWGSVWTRPGLDRRTRSAITLTALTALGREAELELHVRGALRNGLNP